MSSHWSVIQYQMTFEWHSGCGLEISNICHGTLLVNTSYIETTAPVAIKKGHSH